MKTPEEARQLAKMLVQRGLFKEPQTLAKIKQGDAIGMAAFAVLIILGVLSFPLIVHKVAMVLFWFFYLPLMSPLSILALQLIQLRGGELLATEKGLEWSQYGRPTWTCAWDRIDELKWQAGRFLAPSAVLIMDTSDGRLRLPLRREVVRPWGRLLLRMVTVRMPRAKADLPALIASLKLGIGMMMAVAAVWIIKDTVRGLALPQPVGHAGLRLFLGVPLGVMGAILLADEPGNWLEGRFRARQALAVKALGVAPLTLANYANWVTQSWPGFQLQDGVEYRVPAPVLAVFKSRKVQANQVRISVTAPAVFLFALAVVWFIIPASQAGPRYSSMAMLLVMGVTFGVGPWFPTNSSARSLDSTFRRVGNTLTETMASGREREFDETKKHSSGRKFLHQSYRYKGDVVSLPIPLLEPVPGQIPPSSQLL